MGRVWDLLRGWADDRPGGMNESQIARAVGVDPQLVHKWKNGTRPDPANLAKIAQATGHDYERVLVPAVMHDLGYLPPKQVMGNAQHPAPIDEQRLREALRDVPEEERERIIRTATQPIADRPRASKRKPRDMTA